MTTIEGAWDSKWECNPTSIAVMWRSIHYDVVLYANSASKNTNDTSIVQVGENEKKYA